MQHFQASRKPADRGGAINQITTLVAINGVIVLVLIVLALSVPSASEWISSATQAEFIGGNMPVAVPTQIAQPVEQIRTIRND
jgi:hypothetical protein